MRAATAPAFCSMNARVNEPDDMCVSLLFNQIVFRLLIFLFEVDVTVWWEKIIKKIRCGEFGRLALKGIPYSHARLKGVSGVAGDLRALPRSMQWHTNKGTRVLNN